MFAVLFEVRPRPGRWDASLGHASALGMFDRREAPQSSPDAAGAPTVHS
jgi:hypothetical protein